MMFDFSANWMAIVEILVAVFLLAQGVIVLAQDPRASLNRTFFFFQFSVFVWMVGMGLAYLAESVVLSFPLAKLGFLGVMFIPISTYAFSVHFAGNLSQARVVEVGLVVTIAMTFLINHPMFTRGVVVYPWGNYIELGPWSAGVLLLFAVFTTLFARNFFLRFRNAKRGREWYFGAFVFGLFSYAGIVDFLPAYGIEFPFHPPGFVFVGLFSTLMGYFILRYSLTDIKLVLGRTVGHALLAALLGLIYLSLYVVLSPTSRSGLELLINAGLFAAAVYVFGFASKFTRRLVDEVFFRRQINFERLIVRLTKDLRKVRTPPALLKTIFDFVEYQFGIESVAAVFLSQNRQQWQLYRQKSGSSRFSSSEISVSEPITGTFSVGQKAIDVRRVSAERESAQFAEVAAIAREVGGQLVVPLLGRELGAAFIILGPKKSRESYGLKDKSALLALGVAFSAAWENVKLYENIERESRVKLDFVSIASHQLRTPLTRFKWAFEMFSEIGKQKFTEREVALLEELKTTTDMLIGRVGQLLDVAETEKTSPISQPMLIAPIISDVIQRKQASCLEKGLSCETRALDSKLRVVGYEPYVRIILDVLIDNALLYTPAGGRVTVEAAADGNTVRIVVADNGIGIAESEQEEVFSKFFRGSQAVALHPDGTGLGLYYARILAEKQDGALWFSSKELGGTLFYFSLPAAPTEASSRR